MTPGELAVRPTVDAAALGARNAVEVPVKNKLKVLRAELDWSQALLADKVDLSRQTINAIETGKYDPSLPLAFILAKLFDLTIEEVFELRKS